jgi:hypothetical protein
VSVQRFFLIACILLSFGSGAGAQSFNKPEDSKKSEAALRVDNAPKAQEPLPDRRGTDTAPLAIKIVPAENAISKAIEERKDRDEHTANENRLASATEWLAWVTLALAVLSAFQVGLFFWQLRLIRRSVDEAKKGTAAAIASVAVAKETAQIELRAYVHNFRGGITFVNNDEGIQSPAVSVAVKNFGRTPAYEVRGWVGIVVLVPGQPFDEALFRSLADDHEISKDCMPPEATVEYTVPTRVPLPSELLRLVGSPDLSIYAYGEFHYKDVFNRTHFTKFRAVNGGGRGGGMGTNLSACSDGNEST